jgi:hypothetical protein
VGYINPNTVGSQVLSAGQKVTSPSATIMPANNGMSGRTTFAIAVSATLTPTNSSVPTGGVLSLAETRQIRLVPLSAPPPPIPGDEGRTPETAGTGWVAAAGLNIRGGAPR